MQNKNLTFIFGFMLLSCSGIFAQSLTNELSKAMAQVRQGQYYKGTGPFQKAMATSPAQLIKEVQPYLADTVTSVRSLAYELVHAAGKKSSEKTVCQSAVFILVQGCKDKGSGIAGNTSKYLEQYNREDFSVTAKDTISAIIRRGTGYLENVLLVAGYLNLTGTIADVRIIFTNLHQNDKTKWAGHLALARMGDTVETDYCIRIVQTRTINNAVVYNMVPGLIYTRQKAAYDYLVTLLNSDDKNCLSPNPDRGGQIVCGYRIMEFLAPVVVDFPLHTIDGLNQIKTDNYDKALETARDWFKTKAGNYAIKTDTF
jgi:hypothetical protein